MKNSWEKQQDGVIFKKNWHLGHPSTCTIGVHSTIIDAEKNMEHEITYVKHTFHIF